MKAFKDFLFWLFGVACGLSVASWLIANERIGDAIVFVYLTNGFAIVAFLALMYVVLHRRWKHTEN